MNTITWARIDPPAIILVIGHGCLNCLVLDWPNQRPRCWFLSKWALIPGVCTAFAASRRYLWPPHAAQDLPGGSHLARVRTVCSNRFCVSVDSKAGSVHVPAGGQPSRHVSFESSSAFMHAARMCSLVRQGWGMEHWKDSDACRSV